MAGYGLFSFLGLVFLLFQCEGKINAVPGGNSKIVLPGSTVSINWTFTDDPAKSVLEWFFEPGDGSSQQHVATKYPGGKAQLESSGLSGVTIEDPATLVLTNVDQNYNGTYILVLKVIGVVNNQISEVVVLIAQKPNVTFRSCTSSSSVAVKKGDNFTCVCEGNGGNPPATVTWYKDGVQVVEKGKEEKSLTLINVDIKDSGTYKCLAQSHTLTDQKSVEILVYYPIPPAVISFTSIPKKTLLGESAVITCEALAVPLPRYTIIHNDTVVVSTHKTYIITVLKYSHSGSYKCIVTNPLGNSSKALNFSVAGKLSQNPAFSFPESRTTKVPETKSKSPTKEEIAAWYIILVLLLAGFIMGSIFSFIVYRCRRRIQGRKKRSNPEPSTPKSQVDSTYQELDLRKMNTEENYQSLAGNAGVKNNAENEGDNSTYTELSTARDEGNNYQSLT